MSDTENSVMSNVPEAGEELSGRQAEIASLGKDFTSFTHDANFCVYIKIVHDRKEAEEDIKTNTFFPDFVHQFFVDSERIFGYKRPVIRLFYSPSRLKRFFRFEYEEKLTREKDGIAPDNVMEYLSPILEDLEYTQDINQFINEVESKDEKEFRPPGELLLEFERNYKKPDMLSRAQKEQLEMQPDHHEPITNGKAATTNGGPSKCTDSKASSTSLSMSTSQVDKDGKSSVSSKETVPKKYQIFHANSKTKGFEKFQARMQTLIMWFIESATMLDYEDSKWDFFMMFEKTNPSKNDTSAVSTEDRFYFVGYATVYRYYAYPDRTRPRVSQMLLLPSYRRNGLGTALLQSIYDFYKKQPATLDITAEDPDEEFISMRDFLDCKNCLALPAFQKENLSCGWTEDIAKEAQEKLKLCNRQARKVYEILRLRNIDVSDEDKYKNYRLEIKNRLNIPHQKLKLSCDRVEKRGGILPEEVRAQRDNVKLAEALLEENYQELLKQYQHTIDKLNHSHVN